jgi:Fe-S cluster assembly protein SufD
LSWSSLDTQHMPPMARTRREGAVMTIHQTKIRQAATPSEQRYLDLYADVAAKLPGAQVPQVREWREAALDQFALRGLPHRRVEEWKYTDLRTLMPEVYPLAGLSGTAPKVSLEAVLGKALAGLDSYRAVFVGGTFEPQLSNLQGAPGVTFQPLRTAMADERGVAQAIGTLPLLKGDQIAALNTAFVTDGAILSVASDTKLEKPIHLIFIAAADSPSLFSTQNAISVGAGADVSLIETHATTIPGQAFALTRLGIGAQASLRHVRVNLGAGDKFLSSLVAELASGAQYDPFQITAGGALTRAQASIRFEEEGARCHYSGAMLLRGQQHADFTLVVNHAAPGCESRELVKAVLDGRSHGVFQGKVIVERGAQKTDGKQMANALLLSDDAEFDSKPELEIYADDVACNHGATAGQLDEDLMFYLRARGIPEDQARSLLIAAFIGEALDKVKDEALHEALQEKVDAWLAAA